MPIDDLLESLGVLTVDGLHVGRVPVEKLARIDEPLSGAIILGGHTQQLLA